MKSFLLVLIILFVFSSFSWAGREEIPCVNGYCDGWQILLERVNSFDNNPIFHFYNNSGITAFKVMAIINCYDYNDRYLGRITVNRPGPIHKFIDFRGKLPQNTSKMTAEIYYSDTY